jgi:hypothetical protein
MHFLIERAANDGAQVVPRTAPPSGARDCCRLEHPMPRPWDGVPAAAATTAERPPELAPQITASTGDISWSPQYSHAPKKVSNFAGAFRGRGPSKAPIVSIVPLGRAFYAARAAAALTPGNSRNRSRTSPSDGPAIERRRRPCEPPEC